MAYGLGRRADLDPRNRAYPFAAPRKLTISTVLWPRYGPVLNQFDEGACTGFAIAHWLNCKPAHKPRTRYYTNQDGREFYSGATKRDPFPGEYNLATKEVDTGSTGGAACKEAQAQGKIDNYRWIFEGVPQLIQALQLSPVMAGTMWLDGMFEPDQDGYLAVRGALAGGHEYVIVGYNVRSHYFTMLNSWGSGWGRNGYARIRELDMAELLSKRGDLVVPIKV